MIDLSGPILTAAGLIVAALIALIGVVVGQRRDVKATQRDVSSMRAQVSDVQDNVSNSHPVNMRDESDHRHAAIMGLLQKLAKTVTDNTQIMRDNTERIEIVETTLELQRRMRKRGVKP